MKPWNELNYKEKFIRTFAITPFVIIACILAPVFLRTAYAVAAIFVLAITLILQLIFTYPKWRNGE